MTWEGRHLGIRQRLTVVVTDFHPPFHFRDVMTAGAFRSFAHDHYFENCGGRTMMTDVVEFHSPLGPVGWLVDRLFMAGYLRRLLMRRGLAIQTRAEAIRRQVL